MLAGKIVYKDLQVYQLAEDLVVDVYPLLKLFPPAENDNFASQIRRAVTSLPLNIAEGTGSMSFRRFLTFLSVAYGSALEVQTSVRICARLGYFPNNEHASFLVKLDSFLRMLFRYMQYVEGKADEKDRQRLNFQRKLHGWGEGAVLDGGKM